MLLIAIFSSNTVVFCQYANLEFVENKGQWDKKVRFKGTMNEGAFFLEEKGFRVVQHHSKDIERLDEYMHGFAESPTEGSASAKSVIPN